MPTRKHTQLNRKGQALTHRVGRRKGGKEEGTEIEGENKDKEGTKPLLQGYYIIVLVPFITVTKDLD